MITVCSFDVFDTCLTRGVAVPSGVFYDAARRTYARLGIIPSQANVEDFVAARIEAERAARRQTSREEITLTEIWQLLARAMGWQSNATLVDCELEAEAEALLPIASMRAQVQAARKQGNRIVFASDMYLPAEFIQRQLLKHGFMDAGDGLYVSCEAGKTKSTGNLFHHILEQEKITTRQMLHTGDNHHSDVSVPNKLGIQTRHFDSTALTQTELAILQTESGVERASRIAGAMRAFRIGGKAGDNEAMHELTSQFVGPFVMGFATWVLQRAQEAGVKRLYFAARDCQLLCKVARKLSTQFGGIDCRYLYVSRQSLFLPSADAISPEGMPWMRRDWEDPTLKKLLAKIDLDYASAEPALKNLAGDQRDAFRLKSDEDWSRFWQALNTEPVKTKINERIANRRHLTRQYLEAEGLFDGVPWAIVDLGWTLACQQALWKLLEQSGWKEKARGYYLGLVRQRAKPEEAGLSEALFYQPAYDFPSGTRVSEIFARATLLEHIVGCADHPTVHHHEKLAGGAMGPICNGTVNEAALSFCRELHAAALDFVSNNSQLVNDFKDDVACRNAMASLVAGFFASPTEKSARALLGMSATMDQNGFNSQSIVEPFKWGATWDALLPKNGVGAFQQADGFWLEGSLAVTPSRIRRSLQLARRASHQLKRFR